MPIDQATVERALRRAHEAGDVDAARRIAQGWREQQPAAVNPQAGDVLPLPGTPQPAGGGTGETILRSLLPLIVAPLVGRQVVQDTADAAIEMGNPRHTESHYRNLANLPGVRHGLDALGLPVDPPTPEAQAAYTQAAIEGTALGVGGVGGPAISAGAKAAFKQLGRGYRTRPAAQQVVDKARHAGTLVESGAPATTTLRRELGAGAAIGAGIMAPGDALYPGDVPDWLEPILAGAAPGAQHMFRGSEALLVGNPKFRELVTSSSRGGRPSQVIGMLAAYLIVKGLDVTAENIDAGLDWAKEQTP